MPTWGEDYFKVYILNLMGQEMSDKLGNRRNKHICVLYLCHICVGMGQVPKEHNGWDQLTPDVAGQIQSSLKCLMQITLLKHYS